MPTFPRVALFMLLVAGAAASCDLFNNHGESSSSIVEPCSGGCCDACCNGCDEGVGSVVSTGGGPFGCTPATASVACDDGDPCTKDLCAFGGTCAHAKSNACVGPGAYVFGRAFSATSVPNGLRVAVDGAGNTLVAGVFSGTIDLGGGSLLSPPTAATIFLAKFDAKGAPVWSQNLASTNGAAPIAIAVGAKGDIAITGGFFNDIDLGAGPMTTGTPGPSGFVAHLDSDGLLIWGKTFGSGAAVGLDVALDAAGEVAITGTFTGDLALDGSALKGVGANPNFVAKLDPSGKLLWSKAFSDESDANTYPGLRVGLDAKGEVLLGGSYLGMLDLGDGPSGSAGVPGALVLKLDPAGVPLWKQLFPMPKSSIAVQGLAVTPLGTVLLSGSYTGNFPFSPDQHTQGFDHDLFFARFSADGLSSSTRVLGDSGDQLFCTIAVNASGEAVLAGSFTGSLQLDGTLLQTTDPTDTDVFVAKVDVHNNFLWAKRFGDFNLQSAEAVALDAQGNTAIVGSMSGILDFGGGPLAADDSEGAGIFVAKFGP